MARTIKSAAAVTIPSNDYFSKVARTMRAGIDGVNAADEQAALLSTTARVNNLSMLAGALAGCPPVTEELWGSAWREGMTSALAVTFPERTPESRKVLLNSYKGAIMCLTRVGASSVPLAGETLNAYLIRQGVRKAPAPKASVPAGAPEQRIPSLPVAPATDNADTAEKMMHDACLFIASISDTHEAALASALEAVFIDERNALAFLAWFNAREAAAKQEQAAAAVVPTRATRRG